MDEIVQKAIQETRVKARSDVPWKLDEPWKQSIFTYQERKWTPYSRTNEDKSITALALYSWNVDFMLPFPNSRMSKAIEHLHNLVTEKPDGGTTATIIYLQECVDSDLELICAHPWIRDTFTITDVDISNWQSGHYGTITLVDRRLPVTSCFRVHYSETVMERDVLVVDVFLGGRTVRLCNTHLESLALEPPRRIPQMKVCAELMRQHGVDGAVVAGDFNAIQDFDRTLHSSNGLIDAWLTLGGDESDESGHTWGQQAASQLRERFGTSRMDKVYFCGDLAVQSFQLFGSDVCLDKTAERKQIVELGFEKPWVTDHLGVKTVFSARSTKHSL